LIPRGSSDRVKTGRRDVERLVRLLAAGEVHRVAVPTVEAEVAAPDTDRGVVLARLEAQAHALRPLTEGERWTVDALAQLRAERYRPRAWRRFLDRSLRRSAEARAARPEMAAQAWRWAAIGGAAWIAAWQLSRRHACVRLNGAAGLAWWTGSGGCLTGTSGMAEDGDGEPRRRCRPPTR
jgi:hypothetical protein